MKTYKELIEQELSISWWDIEIPKTAETAGKRVLKKIKAGTSMKDAVNDEVNSEKMKGKTKAQASLRKGLTRYLAKAGQIEKTDKNMNLF